LGEFHPGHGDLESTGKEEERTGRKRSGRSQEESRYGKEEAKVLGEETAEGVGAGKVDGEIAGDERRSNEGEQPLE